MIPATPWSSSDSTYSSSLMPPGVWVHSTCVTFLRQHGLDDLREGREDGLPSSGTTRPTRPALRRRSRLGRS